MLWDAPALPDACVPDKILYVDRGWDGLANGTNVGQCRTLGTNAFASIKQALAAATTGQTVQVLAGVYHEKVLVKVEGLLFKGEAGAIIDADKDNNGVADFHDAVTISADKVIMEGFEVRQAEIGIVTSSSGVTIRDNTVHDIYNTEIGGVGILGWGPLKNLAVVNNVVYDTDRQGIYVGNTDSSQTSAQVTVSSNNVHDNGLNRGGQTTKIDPIAIQLHNVSSCSVADNETYGNTKVEGAYRGTGLRFDIVSGCGIQNNRTRGNHYGFDVSVLTGSLVQNNQVRNNQVGFNCRNNNIIGTTAPNNHFCGNATFAVQGPTSTTLPATNCWWGASNGPSGSGPGSGDAVNSTVDYAGFLTQKPVSGLCAQ